jgi:dTDP-4-dehydrorhamnose reductase
MLITGSQGMLATDIARAAAEAGYAIHGTSHHALDILDVQACREALTALRPDVVVNTPGIAVDRCEEVPEDGFRMHTWAPNQMALACEELGSIFVYISTCGLFGDEVRPYHEYDPVVLKTQYARSKYLGEQAAKEACHRTFVVRPGWLFGGTIEHQRNFVYQRFLDAQQKPVMECAVDKSGSPTYTGDVASALIHVLDTTAYGTYHMTNEGGGSRADYVQCIVDAFGLSTEIKRVDSSFFPRSAPVPSCEILDNMNMRMLGVPPCESWQEAIHRYAQQIKAQLPI